MIEEYVNDKSVMKHLDAISRRRSDDFEELTQETLLKMIESEKPYKHIGQFLNDYRKINYNVYRRQRYQENKTVDLDIETIEDDAPADVDQVIVKLSSRRLQKIARLSYAGNSTTKIAKFTQVSKTTLSRQRKQIKRELNAMIAEAV